MTKGSESRLEAQLTAELKSLAEQDRLRGLIQPNGIDLTSNDYLGLTSHPAIRQALIHALERGIPLGSGGSRLLRGNNRDHDALENELARFKQSEAALIFNSGYDANVGVFSTLCGPDDVVFSDALIHASMIDGIRASGAQKQIFAHNDMAALDRALSRRIPGRNRFIAVESLYSMEGDRAPLARLHALAQRHDARLIVDEAHATGVFGPDGAGLCAQAGIQPLVAIHTCGKAWGSSGAFISCSRLIKDFLINRCRKLIFTTAPPPLLTVQWRAALEVIRAEPWRAKRALDLAERFRMAMTDRIVTGASDSQITPVMLGSDRAAVQAAARLQAAGFDIRPIRPPTVPRQTARLRLAFNANLNEVDFDRLIRRCHEIFPYQSNPTGV